MIFFARELELLSPVAVEKPGSNLTGHLCWKRRNILISKQKMFQLQDATWDFSESHTLAFTLWLFNQELRRYDILYRWVLNSSDETLGAVKGNYHRWSLWATHVNCLQRRTFGRQAAGIVLFTPSRDDSVRILCCIIMVQWRLSCWMVIEEKENSVLSRFAFLLS